MALVQEELEIIDVDKLMRMNLKIPEYQRPYRWSLNSTNTLFTDTYEAFKSRVDEYRLGSIILHKTKNPSTEKDDYNIVDGQQRTTTLSILLYILGERGQLLLKEKYKPSSHIAIQNNFRLLQKRVEEISEEERHRYKEYLEKNCTVVKIVTNNEQEAFQFFDSQNSRGKSLKPHDLLKSYHLREMAGDSELLKVRMISEWEDKDQNALEDLFRNYLYPVTRWIKKQDGLNYSSDKLKQFKGIKQSVNLNYAIYHKSSNIFIEQLKTNGSSELFVSHELNQFQLAQPIIAGKRFFAWTLHYSLLLEKVKNKIDSYHKKEEVPGRGAGDIYVKQLYEASLLFYADRFGFELIDESVIRQLYTWCYSLRLKMKAVYPQTVNKYACGQHERINLGKDLFFIMSEMTDPQELKYIIFDELDETDLQNSSYKAVYELMKKWQG